jgi:hypothetical protein
MVVIEFYMQREDGVNLFRTYSDKGFEIQKMGTNEIYAEAIDVEDAGFEYVETRRKIPVPNPEEEPTGGK